MTSVDGLFLVKASIQKYRARSVIVVCSMFVVLGGASSVEFHEFEMNSANLLGKIHNEPIFVLARRDVHKVSIALEVSYIPRIRVPKGSALEIEILDAQGKQLVERQGTTPTEFPPYPVRVRIDESAQFPLKIIARLTSRIGHRFEGERALEATSSIEDPVSIVMQSRTAIDAPL